MQNPRKKISKKLSEQFNFEEIDHRLACGWHVEVEGSGQRKRYIRSIHEQAINLPNLPKMTRRKWIKSKGFVSKFLDGLDYNNQIQSSYELTLLERQINNSQDDVA